MTEMSSPDSPESHVAATERYNAGGESLDAFMRRTAHVNAPASLRRMAWALDKPIQEVVDAHAGAAKG